MKNYVDFFPDTPESFHLRMEGTLASLEESEMKNVRVFSRRMIAVIAAILVLALAATAVAVVQGSALRTQMTQAGSETLAAQVQDVHASDGADGFSFTIDEILWEGEDMFVSYTVTVPEDGNVYLFSPCELRLNGENIGHEDSIDTEFFIRMFALGGEYAASVSNIMQMKATEDIAEGGENLFSCKCLFMQAEKPLKRVSMEEYSALFTEADAHGNANQLLPNADILYYTDTAVQGEAVPAVYFHSYPEVRALMDEDMRITAEDLEAAGIARKVDLREISIALKKTEEKQLVFNDVAQRSFDMDGYSIEITQLNLSHFNMEFEALIRKDDGEITEWSEDEPYGRWYFLCNADGSDLGASTGWSMGGGEVDLLENGERVYRVDCWAQGIYPLEDLTEIYLAPSIYDENGEFVGNDMTRAIKLTPIYNPNLPSITPEPTQDPAENDDLSS